MLFRSGERPIICARELTKAFEEWSLGTAAELLQRVGPDRGEFVLVIGAERTLEVPVAIPDDARVAEIFGRITESNKGSRRDAIRKTGDELGITPGHVFDALERYKKSVK